jgi:hypothetical protein
MAGIDVVQTPELKQAGKLCNKTYDISELYSASPCMQTVPSFSGAKVQLAGILKMSHEQHARACIILCTRPANYSILG